MAKSIKFTSSGSSSALGNFAPGDIARNIPDALADHLVKEALCAKYLPDTVVPGAASAESGAPAPVSAQRRTPRKAAAAPAADE